MDEHATNERAVTIE